MDVVTYALCKKLIKQVIGETGSLGYKVVTELPTTGETKYIYLVKKQSLYSIQNTYDEYIWVENAWESLGTISLELDQYVAKDELANMEAVKDKEPKVHIGPKPPTDTSKLWIDTDDESTNGKVIEVKTKDEWNNFTPLADGIYFVYDPALGV